KKVVMPATISVPTVVPFSLSLKNFSIRVYLLSRKTGEAPLLAGQTPPATKAYYTMEARKMQSKDFFAGKQESRGQGREVLLRPLPARQKGKKAGLRHKKPEASLFFAERLQAAVIFCCGGKLSEGP